MVDGNTLFPYEYGSKIPVFGRWNMFGSVLKIGSFFFIIKYECAARALYYRWSILMVSSIRSPMIIQGRLECTETNQMHLKWEVA